MPYQSQSNALVAFKAQSAKGTYATGGSGFVLRIAGGPGGKLTKKIYESNEVRRDGMRSLSRHGLRSVSGSYTCELSLDHHDAFYEALFRGSFESSLALSESDFTSLAVSSNVVTLGSGSPISLGLRNGDVIRFTNMSASGNNSRNIRIGSLTSTTFTSLETLTNQSADTACNITRPGQKLINPATLAARTYFTIEEYEADGDLAEICGDCCITSIKFSMGSSGLLMVEIGFTGTGLFSTVSGGSAPSLTSPTESTGLPLSVADATLRYSSTDFVDLTSWELTLDIGAVAPEVAGSQISPDVFSGQMAASMNFSMLRSDYAKMTDFLAETQLTFQMLACENESEPRDFLSLYIPRFTIGDIDKSPLSKEAGPRTQTISVPVGLIGKDTSGSGNDATMIKLQVSNT